MVINGNTDRETANAMMRQVLDANPGIISTWTIWEPNGFDGRDADFASTKNHDATGRFVPYWIQDGKGGHASDAIIDYDKENYYQIPRRTGKTVMQEPYVYNYGGREILQTAVTVPVMVNGKFLGVAGVSVPLNNLQKMVREIKIYDSGYVRLISNQGVIVGAQNTDILGKNISQAQLYTQELTQKIATAVRTGQHLNTEFDDPNFGGDAAMLVVAPMQMELADTPWSFVASVPMDEVLADVHAMQWLAGVLGVLSVLLTSVGLVLAVNRLVLRPLGGNPSEAASLAQRVAQGDLTHHIAVQPGDNFSLMYQLQRMQQSLVSLVSQVRDGAQSVAAARACSR